MPIYLRTEDVAAAIKHGAVTDCVIYSVDDPRVSLVEVQVPEDEGPITTTDGAVVDTRAAWSMPA
jgi:hypothetical protein